MTKKLIDLPSKDKYGNPYLSYSQISLFLKNKQEFFNTYILKKPFEGNEYTEFGKKVGEAIEKNDFSGFSESEQSTLKLVTRLDVFERKTILKYDDFYVIGFVDSVSSCLNNIIDYKTVGLKKEFEYTKPEYNQLHY